MVQNAAARVLTRTRKYDHISPVLSTLHLLPIKHRIDFKILLITYKALNGLAPQYLSELLSHYSPPCLLRFQNSGHLIIPRISKSTAGGRSFSYLAPKLWNNLPISDDVLDVSETFMIKVDRKECVQDVSPNVYVFDQEVAVQIETMLGTGRESLAAAQKADTSLAKCLAVAVQKDEAVDKDVA